MDLLLWFGFEEDEITSLVNIQVLPDGSSLEEFFNNFWKPPFSGGGIEEIKKEYIKTPKELMGVDGMAYVMYVYGKRFRAALPWLTLVKENA